MVYLFVLYTTFGGTARSCAQTPLILVLLVLQSRGAAFGS